MSIRNCKIWNKYWCLFFTGFFLQKYKKKWAKIWAWAALHQYRRSRYYNETLVHTTKSNAKTVETAFVIVLMLLFSWWCDDDFTKCFHWALSTKKFDQESSIYSLIHHRNNSETFCNVYKVAFCFEEFKLGISKFGQTRVGVSCTFSLLIFLAI